MGEYVRWVVAILVSYGILVGMLSSLLFGCATPKESRPVLYNTGGWRCTYDHRIPYKTIEVCGPVEEGR